jgi:hypothetical protein
MSGPASQPQWYLAREGKQLGPISEAELTKFIEQGHLLPTDLLWREGFPDWRPAMAVFPPRSAAAPRSAPTQQRPATGRVQPAGPPHDSDWTERADRDDASARGFRPGRIVVVLLLVAALGGGGWFAYANSSRLLELFNALTASSGAVNIADRKSLEVPPLTGFRGGTAATIDASLQATALWRVIKREFPEWYTQRLNEAATLAGDGKDDAAIGQHMARRLRELRRQQAANGLSATLPLLGTVAAAYFDSLVKLRRHSAEVCNSFIRQGEAAPVIIGLLQGSEHAAHLQAQLTSVFEAIAEGRRQPRVHIRPRPQDYETLVAGLAKLGWTAADIQLWQDEKALAQAAPEKLCQMVHDWFQAQLAFPDPEIRNRLLVDALRPVFAG